MLYRTLGSVAPWRMANLVEFLELHILLILFGASIYILVIYISYDPTRCSDVQFNVHSSPF
jgi:hypothetical protein